MFSGSIPALVTPFRNGSFDEDAYRDFVEWQLTEGSSAVVPCGTTGESATLTFEEHFHVVRTCVDQVRGRVPVIAGAGSNDTQVAIKNIRTAKEAGADAALMVPPYYNRPNQDGIFAHFEAVVTACDLPVVLYNVPGRTVTDIKPETVVRLARAFPQIVAIKDASGDMPRVSMHRGGAGPDFVQLSGNDDMALAFNALGGRGCISVTANVAPRLCADMQAAMLAGDYDKALAINDLLYPLHAALFSDASPGPVKYALNRIRPNVSADVRLPMTLPSTESCNTVARALDFAGISQQ
ncbi:4-hydroxy-tetrahydrodipicolinate synthase [Sphingomonas floccifaciens]|uniref:4-hydroxy-tetrahydrodipicolinate synthase n=1 Tax=Sphingomonas floccifaciens TaxID=1844115 RepID=A0ABW4NAY1_9SPHN